MARTTGSRADVFCMRPDSGQIKSREGRSYGILVVTLLWIPIILGNILLVSSLLSKSPQIDRSDFSLQVSRSVQMQQTQTQALSKSLGQGRDGWGIYNGVLSNQGGNSTEPAIITALIKTLGSLRCTPDRLEGESRLGCAVIIRDPERRWCQRECMNRYGLEFRFFPLDAGKKHLVVQFPATFCGSGGCAEQLYIKRREGWTLLADVFGILEISQARTNGIAEVIVDGQFRLVWDGAHFVAKGL